MEQKGIFIKFIYKNLLHGKEFSMWKIEAYFLMVSNRDLWLFGKKVKLDP